MGKLPISVLVLIHTRELRILLLERAKHPGFWQSVTGSKELYETLERCALRETFEETGISVNPEFLYPWNLRNRFAILPQWRERYGPQVTHNEEYVYSVCLAQEQKICIEQSEHRAFAWVDLSDAANTVFSWSNRDAILMLPHFVKG